MVNAKIRILIADDYPVVREGLLEILNREDDMSVIGEATNGEEACLLYDKLSPDIVLLDLRMPRSDENPGQWLTHRSPYLIGGIGRFAWPGCIQRLYSRVYQGAFTSGAGGVSFALWRR
jgi:hypothetical protein